MPFVHHRTVRFADTDAAGVVFFARYLAICHEAYEEALAAAGLELGKFFAANAVVVPVARSECDYLRPLLPGDKLRVTVAPAALTADSFALSFEIFRLGPPDKLAARARTEHVCIASATRQRQALPSALSVWIAAG
jgi:1,4-dihydroxy-2-naphthoyl-CoA hydrolase